MLRRHNESHPVKARVINVASWAGLMASPFIGFYNATKYGLIGLTESMYYDLRLLDIHAVLAVPGITKTPLLTKTTGAALASLDGMPAADRDRYLPYLEHFTTMSQSSDGMSVLLTPAQVAVSSPRSPAPAIRASGTTWRSTPSWSTALSPGYCRSGPGPPSTAGCTGSTNRRPTRACHSCRGEAAT